MVCDGGMSIIDVGVAITLLLLFPLVLPVLPPLPPKPTLLGRPALRPELPPPRWWWWWMLVPPDAAAGVTSASSSNFRGVKAEVALAMETERDDRPDDGADCDRLPPPEPPALFSMAVEESRLPELDLPPLPCAAILW